MNKLTGPIFPNPTVPFMQGNQLVTFGMHELEKKFGHDNMMAHFVGLAAVCEDEKEIQSVHMIATLLFNSTTTLEKLTFDQFNSGINESIKAVKRLKAKRD